VGPYCRSDRERAGDAASQRFATSLGAVWAGSSEDMPPEPLDAAIVFAPLALSAVKKGGREGPNITVAFFS
jgi:propanol-preferring alcohol dehydrogenase